MATEYHVVGASGREAGVAIKSLEAKVNQKLGDGWKLQGGVSFDFEPSVGVAVFQAVVRLK